MSNADRPLTDADYVALARFRHALRTFIRFSEQAARDAGLTPSQHQLLLAIRGYAGGGDPTLSAVAEMLQLKLHSVVELADRAEANGLIKRHDDPSDRRRAMVQLTPKGQEHLSELSVLHRDELRRFRHEMGALLTELDES